MEQPNQENFETGVTTFNPEYLRSNFEKSRIPLDLSFASLYSSFENDVSRVENLKERFAQQESNDETGMIGESLVFARIQEGVLGTGITARATSLYDDFFHGADIVIESKAKQQRDPIISSIDVTISQQAFGVNQRSKFESEGVVNEVGLEKKLQRVVKHIKTIANFSPEKAIELSAWLQSGGLAQPRTSNNQKYFDDAERLMLLKYYKNPETSDEPDKPHFVMSGPQVVLSIDRAFVNKAITAEQSEKALKDIDTLIQVEVPYAVAVIARHVDELARKMAKERVPSNLFFDMMRASCRAWELTFAGDQNQFRLQKAIQVCQKDPELKKQLQYYQVTLNSLLAVK